MSSPPAPRPARAGLSVAAAAAMLALVLALGGPSFAQEQGHAAAPQQQPCFGAAARDPQRPCRNARLRRAVVPQPEDAQIEPNSPCTPIEHTRVFLVCAFGVAPEHATQRFALLGDSHASHWRAAMDVVARTKQWYGLSVNRSSCPYSTARPRLPAAQADACVTWSRKVVQWFGRHPEVRTVFVSDHSGRVVHPPGISDEEAQMRGFAEAWAALPKTVERIVVIRDTPRNSSASMECVQRAISARRNAARVCALPRRFALRPDTSVSAALRLRSPRVQVVSLTDFMCSRRSCFPVIGGALVHKDIDHLTAVFASTLGPYLLRAIEALPPAAPQP